MQPDFTTINKIKNSKRTVYLPTSRSRERKKTQKTLGVCKTREKGKVARAPNLRSGTYFEFTEMRNKVLI